MDGLWRSGSPFRTPSAFGVAFAGGGATIGGGPASAGCDGPGNQVLERRLQFLGACFAPLKDDLAATLDQAAGLDEEDLPDPLPVGPGQLLARRPPCRERVQIERQDGARPPGSVGADPAAGRGAAREWPRIPVAGMLPRHGLPPPGAGRVLSVRRGRVQQGRFPEFAVRTAIR